MAVYTTIHPAEIVDIAHQFGLKNINKICGVKAGTVHTFYSFHANHKKYFLRLDEVGEKKCLSEELALLVQFEKFGNKLPFITPKLLKLRKSKNYTARLRKHSINLFHTVPGQPVSISKLNLGQLESIGKSLAHLHSVSINTPLRKHRFNRSLLSHKKNRVINRLRKKNSAHARMLSDAWQASKNIPKISSPVIIHGDLFPENIHFNKNKVVGILDFESAGLGYALFDLATAINALCYLKGGYSLQRSQHLLKGYVQKNSGIRSDLKHLNFFLLRSCLRFCITRLVDFEFAPTNQIPEPFRRYEDYLSRIKSIDNFVGKLVTD